MAMMKAHISIWLAALISLSAAFAGATDDNADAVKVSAPTTLYGIATKLPQTLISLGQDNVGRLRMSDLVRDFLKVQVVLFGEGYPIGSTGLRSGMVNYPSQTEIVMSPLAFNRAKPEVREYWFFHENIEAVCYNDENYQLTVGLWWASQVDAHARSAFLSGPVLDIFNHAKRSCRDRVYVLADAGGGGATGTGGGGDEYSLMAKMSAMRSASKFLDAHPVVRVDLNELYARIMNVDVETDYAIDARTAVSFSKNSDGHLQVNVPFLTVLDPPSRERGTEIILEKLSGI